MIAGKRPRLLKEVERLGREFGGIDNYLREFLDEFYTVVACDKRAGMLLDEPDLGNSDHANAYLGAVAEHLALRNHFAVPFWVENPSRFLKRPFFPCGLESLKATLLMESPVAFRRRMIFVGSDPLYRPRKDSIGIGQ